MKDSLVKRRDRRGLLIKPSNPTSLTAVDLFAGGGGLTLGLKRAGFNVVAAVEVEPHAFSTYKANHPEVHALKQDIRTVSGESLLQFSPSGEIDLLAGCPPCQGFTSLTSKYKRFDPRNILIREMSRLVKESSPRAVMMENVPGLTTKGKELFVEFLEVLGDLGYFVSFHILQTADYGVPQSRRRLVLLAGKGFSIDIPKPTHSRLPNSQLKAWRTLRDGLPDLPRPLTLDQSARCGGPLRVNWHVVRSLSPRNRRRIRLAKPGKVWTAIPRKLRPACHQRKSAGFTNVYGRMAWGRVAPTITAGFATLSKGRFGHPDQDRTISVREAASLQTFPLDYIFDTPFMEYVCDIVGNALPPRFAQTLSHSCHQAIFSDRAIRAKRHPENSHADHG
jgi:DNA (cytosine-5)-methyltransferase 1